MIDEECGFQQVFALIKKVYCFVGMINPGGVTSTTLEISELIRAQLEIGELQGLDGECNDEIDILIMKLIEFEDITSALLLLRCRCELVKKICNEESRIARLEKTGMFMLKISRQMMRQNRQDDFKKQHLFMDEVASGIRLLSDVNVDDRCRYVVSFYLNYGLCCFSVEDYQKSMNLFKEAIHTMELVYADHAVDHEEMVKCYNNLGLTYQHLEKPSEARRCFDEATKIFEKFTVRVKDQSKRKKKKGLMKKILIKE